MGCSIVGGCWHPTMQRDQPPVRSRQPFLSLWINTWRLYAAGVWRFTMTAPLYGAAPNVHFFTTVTAAPKHVKYVHEQWTFWPWHRRQFSVQQYVCKNFVTQNAFKLDRAVFIEERLEKIASTWVSYFEDCPADTARPVDQYCSVICSNVFESIRESTPILHRWSAIIN